LHRFSEFSRDFILKSRESIVGEIEQQMFRKTLCVGVFSIGKKSLVKSTLCVKKERKKERERERELGEWRRWRKSWKVVEEGKRKRFGERGRERKRHRKW
jgi:hypothetical protein